MKNKVFAMIIGTVIALAAVSVIIDASSGTASAASPYAPTDLEVDLGDKEITLKWKAPADSDPDSIYYAVHMNGERIETLDTGTEYLFKDLTAGNEYRLKVAAIYYGEGGEETEYFSDELTVRAITTPKAPQNLNTILGDGTITLKWNAPEFDGGDPITHYIIYKDGKLVTELVGDDDDEAVAKKIYTTSFTFTDLTIGEEYSFKVAAVNSAGDGIESEEVTDTPATRPGAPTDLQVECGEEGKSVKLEWIAPEDNGGSDIIGYNVYKDGKLLEDLTVVIDDDTATVTIEGLIPNTQYKFKVTAFNEVGEGKASNEEIIKTPVAPYIELGVEEGTVGPETSMDEDGIVKGTIYSIYYVWNGEEYVASLGTEVTIKGYHFADGSKTKVNVVVTIDGENYLVVKDYDTVATGYFEASFIFPTAPSGKYTITVSDTSEHDKDATADFTVIPGLIITKPVVTGPSVLEIVATGFPMDEYAVLLIDGTDALFGTNMQMQIWQFNEYGVLVNSMLGPMFKPGFVLPVLEAGDYNITLLSLGSEYYASRYVYVQNDIADLGTIIGEIISIKDGIATIQTDLGEVKVTLADLNSKILAINGDLITIQTHLGEVKVSLEDLNVKILDVDGKLVTIKTDLGTIEASLTDLNAKVVDVIDGIATIKTDLGTIEASLTDLNAKVVAIDGKLITIQTHLGEVKVSLEELDAKVVNVIDGIAKIETKLGNMTGKITSITDGIATIQTDLGEVKADVSKQSSLTADIASGDAPVTIDSTPTWIAAIMAVIAAVSAIGCLVILVRKLA